MNSYKLMLFIMLGLIGGKASGLAYTCQVGFGELIPLRAEVRGTHYIWNHADRVDSSHPVRRKELRDQGEVVGFVETVYVDQPEAGQVVLNFPDDDTEIRTKPFIFRWMRPSADSRLGSESESFAELAVGSRDRGRLIVRVMKTRVPVAVGIKMDFSGSGEVLVKDQPAQFVLDVAADEDLQIGLVHFRLESIELKLKCSKQ